MLKNTFNFQIASYRDIASVDPQEASQADLIYIDEQVPGAIYTPERALWYGSLEGCQTASEFIFSKRARKKTLLSKDAFEKAGFHFEILTMTEELFEEFLELYKETTLKKERALIYNLHYQILGRLRTGGEVYLAAMMKENKLNSAIVFSKVGSKFIVSFGAKQRFQEIRGGVGGVLEYMLIKFALEKEVLEISHGKGSNPLGLFTKAGIFEFKAHYGFSAFPDGAWHSVFLQNRAIVLSDLIFLHLDQGELEYLVISDNDQEELRKKYRTRLIRKVKKCSFDEAEAKTKTFLAQLAQ